MVPMKYQARRKMARRSNCISSGLEYQLAGSVVGTVTAIVIAKLGLNKEGS
jgi:hypothetical protein